MSDYESFKKELKESVLNYNLIKLTLGNNHGEEVDLKNIYCRLVSIKNEVMLSFVFRFKTKDITKNYKIDEAIEVLVNYTKFKGFRSITLQTQHEILNLQMNKRGDWYANKTKSQNEVVKNLAHDKKKDRKLEATDKKYLHELQLTDENGVVYKRSQDKWKQINHYIELLSTSLRDLPMKSKLNVVDMGAGKGYLTFALYDYLTNELSRNAEVTGVEFREDLVEFCNQVAVSADFNQLSFVRGAIDDYQQAEAIDVLIALHACDTATDDAIYKGIVNESSLIVVAPCCHKQVRKEIEKSKPVNDLDFMCKHGIFLERHAEMLTDSIRALILEYYGYQTKVVQFISDQHTPKNVMIVGVKAEINENNQVNILKKIAAIKSYFGLSYQHLEKLCGLTLVNK